MTELNMRNFLLGMVAGALLFVLCGVAYLRMGFAEARADLAPAAWEMRLMRAAVHASVRRRAPEMSNPVRPTEENLIAGGKLFINGCSGCHGRAGSAEDISGSLFPPIPQFHKEGTSYTEAQIFWIAKHGIRRTGMFANGKWNSDQELWTMAAYIKRMRELSPAVQAALAPKNADAPK
jgi:mono/diheme cytochrome c family protein